MASTAHTSNRRSFLAGTAVAAAGLSAVPAMAIAAASAQPIVSRAAWNGAMREYTDAQALAGRLGESEAFADIADNALCRLIRMPSPDLNALRWKIDYFMRNDDPADDGAFGYEESFVSEMRADLCRLMGGAK